MENTRPTVMEVDLKACEYNLEQIQNYVGENVKIMPVVKANGYGTYVNKASKILEKFDLVAVAIVDEALELRKCGYNGEIFVLNQPYKDEIEKIAENKITIGLSSDSFLEEIGKLKNKIKVHIEIGTGMGRTGINPGRVYEYVSKVKEYSNIEIEGIYTHLSSADIDEEYTKMQLDLFKKSVDIAEVIVGEIKYKHCSASNGILNYSNSYYNLVRPGIILYGYEPFENAKQKMDLQPICKLKSKITFLKEVDKNTSISYSRKFITKRKTKIATIPIGYADGLKRCLSNKGEVVINNKKVPIVGNICMDGFMADVTDLEHVAVGDDVYIWDNNLVTVEEIAKLCGTINYEILSTISDRVPRIYIS